MGRIIPYIMEHKNVWNHQAVYIYTRTLLASRIPLKNKEKTMHSMLPRPIVPVCLEESIYIHIYYHLILIVILVIFIIHIMNIQISFLHVIVMSSSLNLQSSTKAHLGSGLCSPSTCWRFWADFTGNATVNRKNQEPKSPKTSWIRARTSLNWC